MKSLLLNVQSQYLTFLHWWRVVLDLVFPPVELSEEPKVLEHPYCEKCSEFFKGDMYRSDSEDGEKRTFECANCRGRDWSLDYARTGFHSTGVVREIIHGFKYEGVWHGLTPLSQWLCDGYDRHYVDDQWDALIPVPLFYWRWIRRGFNQSEELAKELSKHSGVPVWNALKRIKSTEVQARLSRAKRLENQRGAYSLRKGGDWRTKVKGAHLLIIDDVFTSGATTDACAKVLKRTGASKVCVLTVARG